MRRNPNEVFGKRMGRLLRTYRVPGCSVACVAEGRLAWTGAFGTADETLGTEVTTSTTFQTASLSKIVTSWTALKLVVQGLVELDEHLAPRLPVLQLLGSSGLITLRALLSHTAGLPSGGSEFYARIDDVPQLERAIIDALAADSVIEAGTRFRYSNPGYAVVELLIEQLTGATFADWTAREVLQPLAMNRSTFDRARSFDPEAAGPHLRRGRPIDRTVLGWLAAGGLHASAEDLARLIEAMCGNGHRERGGGVLPSELLEEMWQPPAAAAGAFYLRDGGYALGQLSGRLASGTRFIANQGTRRGWRSLLLCLPDRGQGFVALTNSNSGTALTMHLAALWLRKVAGERLRLHRVVRLTRSRA